MSADSPAPPSFLALVLKQLPSGIGSFVVLGVLAYFNWFTERQVPWFAWFAVVPAFLLIRFVQKVWEELEPDAVKGTAGFIRTAPRRIGRAFGGLVQRVTDRTESRYLTGLAHRFGLFNDRGLGLINANRLDLERVYVDLRTNADMNPTKLSFDPVARGPRSSTIMGLHAGASAGCGVRCGRTAGQRQDDAHSARRSHLCTSQTPRPPGWVPHTNSHPTPCGCGPHRRNKADPRRSG